MAGALGVAESRRGGGGGGGPGEGVDEVGEVEGLEGALAAAEVAPEAVADGLQADRVQRHRLLQLLLGLLRRQCRGKRS